jgi:TonB-linked SusC/RagA family outer membrane protein
VPRLGTSPDTMSTGVAESRMSSQVQRLFSLYNDTYLSYDKLYGTTHSVSARLGLRYSNNSTEEDYGLGFNSATDELQTIGTGSTALRQAGGDMGKWTWLNYYAAVDYGLRDKYFLTFNMAMDGSSRFGKEAESGVKLFDNSFGFFPSLGAAWLLSSEDFMANVNALEMLKLRASYGLTGNDDIGNYTARQYYVSQNLLGRQGIVRGNIGNFGLQWETHKKLNVGLDAALLNERLTLSVDVYHNTVDNMLTFEPAGTVAGFDFTLTNNGGMKNQGVEVALNSRVLNGAVKWDAGLILAKNQNELTKLPGGPMRNTFAGATIISQVGQPVNAFYGFKTNGVYATNAEAEAAGLTTRQFNGSLASFQGGDVRFVNQDGDSEINDNDRVVIGDPNPDFTGMLSNRLAWKNLALDAALTFSYGNDVYNYTRAQLEAMRGPENQTLLVRNRWIADGQVTNVPRAAWGDPMGNARFSDRWIEDGSYLRLRSLSLSYYLPIKEGFLKSSSVYLTGTNLLTFSKYLGYDPEFSASGNRLMQGVDTGLEPQFKSVMLGFRLGL